MPTRRSLVAGCLASATYLRRVSLSFRRFQDWIGGVTALQVGGALSLMNLMCPGFPLTKLSLRSCAAYALLSSSLLAGCSAVAAAQNRILQNTDGNDATRITLPDGVSPRTRAAQDLGLVAPDKVLGSVTLRFNQTAAQRAGLEQLLGDQQNPASVSYRQWLTPEQFGQRFGLSPADLAAVAAWLRAQGLTVTAVSRSRTFVTVSGSAAQVQAAFRTPIHQVETNGDLHFANLTSPSLPAAIANVVAGITGLNDFRLKPHNRAHMEPAPQFTSSVSGNHFIAPGDFYTIYDINPLLQTSIDGSGITIAVMGQTDLSLADVAAFRSASGLAAKAPTVQLFGTDPGNASADDTIEAHLDVEWSGAVAPGATVLYVNSKDVLNTSLVSAIDNNLAPILTLSYGDCESGFGAANIATFNALFQQANAQGQTILSASGDSGATDCDFRVAIASGGLAVDYPGSSPNVSSIGGTMFNEGSGTYFKPTNGANSGSAISYIPEAVWNESSGGNLAAGGGGASGSIPKPAWQTGTGVPNDARRDVPDIALNAAASHDGYLYCANGFCSNGYRNAAGNLEVVGGTSVAAPSFAGVLALLEQKLGARIGNANPTIYGLANSTFAAAVFHDVTSGNNDSPCKAGTTGCASGGSLGYNAGTGYDLATGWGSVDGFNFVNDWALVQPTGSGATTADFSLSPSTSTATARSGAAAPGLTFTVSAVNGFAGSVRLSAAASPSVAASYTFSLSPVVLSSSATSGSTVLTLFATPSASGGGASALVTGGTATQARLGNSGTAPWIPLGSGVALAGLLLVGLPRRRRARWSALAMALVAGGMLAISGCGSGGSASSSTATNATPTGAAAGTYTVVVSASGTDASGKAIAHTATVTFTVQ